MLGSFADDEELDRPDLNKCPDCGCFFAQEKCPLCGRICPEEMRAGNRAPVKHKKRHNASGSDRVTFISWYHSWWFIALMMFFIPIAGIILLVTSPHKRWKKILFIAIAVVYTVVTTIGIGNIFGTLEELWEQPVDTKLTKEEYVTACQSMTGEDFYRIPEAYAEKKISMSLTVIKRVTPATYFYDENEDPYYLCQTEEGASFYIVLRNCLLDGKQNLIEGDRIVVYGEGAGSCTVFDGEGNEWEAPCLNMAYVTVQK
jgi:hypothetical protein